MRRFAVGIPPLLLVCEAEAVTQAVPLFPAASENRQGFIRVINPTPMPATAHHRLHRHRCAADVNHGV